MAQRTPRACWARAMDRLQRRYSASDPFVRIVAAHARVDARTVVAYLEGRAKRPLTIERIEETLRRLGRDDLAPGTLSTAELARLALAEAAHG